MTSSILSKSLSSSSSFSFSFSSSSPATLKQQQRQKMSILMLALILSISTLIARAEAKPLNQNQVKFRRLPPKEFSAALGSSITIECEAGASPPPTIHWLKNGKRILQNDFDDNQLEDGQAMQVDDVNRIALSSTRSRLFIDCADYNDEAVYTCIAENAFSRVSSHTKLNLIKPTPQPVVAGLATGDNDLMSGGFDEAGALDLATSPNGGDNGEKSQLSAVSQCLSRRSSRTIEPVRIHMWTHNIVEVMKNNIILYCRSNIQKRQVSANQPQSQSQQQQSLQNEQQQQQQQQQDLKEDIKSETQAENKQLQLQLQLQQQQQQPATITWTLPDDKLVSSEMKDKYEILATGDLLIKDLKWSDMGSYVCSVSDDQTSDSISTFVYPAAVKANNKRATLNPRHLAYFR